MHKTVPCRSRIFACLPAEGALSVDFVPPLDGHVQLVVLLGRCLRSYYDFMTRIVLCLTPALLLYGHFAAIFCA